MSPLNVVQHHAATTAGVMPGRGGTVVQQLPLVSDHAPANTHHYLRSNPPKTSNSNSSTTFVSATVTPIADPTLELLYSHHHQLPLNATTAPVSVKVTPRLKRARSRGSPSPIHDDAPTDHHAHHHPDERGHHARGRAARTTKVRPVSFERTMEPPILSFYGTEPVPLPSRFGALKKRLVAGHEPALEASWARLVTALREETAHIRRHGSDLIPSIEFSDMDKDDAVGPFKEGLRRHGIGVVRGVVPRTEARAWVEETKQYLQKQHDFKPPPAQDPTCFEFYWSPAQVRSRAHPNVLQAQRFAMSLWDTQTDDRLATRFPITYADRIRIESVSNGELTVNGSSIPVTPEDSLIAAAAASSSAQIAQVDNGSLERWEQDGYGRGGLYDPIFRGEWEAYNPWNPSGRINATSDLYNGAGACSMLRLFQGILALTVVEPGMIKLLPSPKLSTAYFLLRPFFSPKLPAPGPSDGPEKWEAYLDPSNWSIDREQSTIIHGAVPGHAQRVTAAWHPHLDLDNSLIAPPTLQVGDYIVWHPDQAYQFSNTNYRGDGRPANPSSAAPSAPSTPPNGTTSDDGTSMLVYTPAAPLTQTNALFLSRQRKAFLRGHPGPDFDSTGTGMGSEAPHVGRLGKRDIQEVGGEEALQAMGLSPWSLGATYPQTPLQSPPAGELISPSLTVTGGSPDEKTPHAAEFSGDVPSDRSSDETVKPTRSSSSSKLTSLPIRSSPTSSGDSLSPSPLLSPGFVPSSTPTTSSGKSSSAHGKPLTPNSHAEAEVLKLANVILFPDRYEFYMPTRASSPVPPPVAAAVPPTTTSTATSTPQSR